MWGKDRRRKRKFKGEIESLSARRRRKTFFFLGRECLLWKNLTLLSAKPQTESSFSSFLRGKFKSTLPTHTQSSPFFPFLTDCNLTHLLLQREEGKGDRGRNNTRFRVSTLGHFISLGNNLGNVFRHNY